MTALIVGSGGREHAIQWRLAAEGVDVLVAPGNAGTPQRAPVPVTDILALADLAEREHVDLTIVGPEAPLAEGIADTFTARGLKVFGPSRAAARLEWSKAWTKSFLQHHAIPTARATVVSSEFAARRAIQETGLPVVLKADGLAAGKGVFVVNSHAEVDRALDQLFHKMGEAASHALVEECLEGHELSVLVFTDGERLAVMPPARDYKRLLEGDRGPNTGGMGGLTWPEYATRSLLEEIEERILRPTLKSMATEGTPYRGVLYAGLMLTADGPKVLEFNCRFGDPECQLILPLFDGSLIEVCAGVADGELPTDAVRWRDGRTFGVVLASHGYPDAPRNGDTIRGLSLVSEDVHVFHSGTRVEDDQIVTAGGRVLTLVGSEREAVYRAVNEVVFEGKQFRPDIGAALVGATR